MATAKYYAQDGSESGTVELSDKLFGAKINEGLIHQAVVQYLANQRQGTVNTKERSDVRGGGKKPFRQKGTGRARAGTIRSPLWKGGGTVFGPHPRDHRLALPKKMRRNALRSALSSRASQGSVLVIDDLNYAEPKTKKFAGLLASLGRPGKKVLLILDAPQETVMKSARNIDGVRVTQSNTLSTYDVMWADTLLVTQSGLKKIEEVFAS